MPKPYVICHMCTTIDGKVLSSRWPTPTGVSRDLFETTAASFNIPAWLVGTTTMREFSGRDQKLPTPSRGMNKGDHVAQPKAKKLAIGVDTKGALRFQENEVEGDHIVVLTTERASLGYRQHLQNAGVSYLICGRKQLDLTLAMSKLHDAFSLKKLMLQGGGTFNGAVLQAGLVDEISQVTVPVVDGGGPGVTGFFDAPGKPPKKSVAKLRVISHKSLPGGAHWFKYKVL